MSASEYLPSNGNGHDKAFVLAKTKSPEELAREALRREMPKFRRAVFQMRILAQAKWMFAAVSDDSFMFDFGGDGFGTMWTSIRDLSLRYGHDRNSIAKWLAILERHGVIWLDWQHPFVGIHISAAVPSPKHQASVIQRMKARGENARRGRAEDVSMPFFVPSEGEPARKAEEIRTIGGDVPARCAEDVSTIGGDVPARRAEDVSQKEGQLQHTPPTTPAHRAEDTSTVCGKVQHTVLELSVSDLDKTQAGTAKSAPLERTPVLENQKKEKRGETPPPDLAFERWIKGLDGQFPSHLRALERKIKARLETVRSEAARAGLKRQLKEVQARILPPVEDAPVKATTATASTATTKAPKLTDAARKRMAAELAALRKGRQPAEAAR